MIKLEGGLGFRVHRVWVYRDYGVLSSFGFEFRV